MTFGWRALFLAVWLGLAGTSQAAAQACTNAEFAAAVDAAGVSLRSFNMEAAPKLQAKMRQLKEKKGWSEAEYEEKSTEYLRDDRTAELDATANDLLIKIDTLGRPPEGKAPDCAGLDELRAAGVELLAVMKAKSTYTLGKIDAELGTKTAALEPTPAPAPTPAKKEQAEPKSTPAAKQTPAPPPAAETVPVPVAKPKPPVVAAAPAEKRAPPAPEQGKVEDKAWGTTTAYAPPDARTGLPPPPPGEPLPPGALSPDEDGYTIEEIRDATQGFFGTISTNLAAVLEHAFRKSGRPTAYVLGQEGGGAFLAGLRYGDGTLYLRAGGTQKVFWHGPSIGSDFGAEGSRTLFLIYHLHQPDGLFRSFTGIDGSAYFVGGVGITFLKGGEVLMAPIRSGMGLRIGANLGYVRFTPRPTWNPF